MANGHGGARNGSGRKLMSPQRRRAIEVARMQARAQLRDQRAAADASAKDAPPEKRTEARKLNFQAIASIMEASRDNARNRERSHEWCPYVIRPELQGPPPPKKYAMAMDQDIATNTTFAINAWMAGGLLSNIESEGLLWLGYPILSELAQRPEYRVISETIATEMTRKWIRFKGTSDGKKKKNGNGEETQSNPPGELMRPHAEIENDPAEEKERGEPTGEPATGEPVSRETNGGEDAEPAELDREDAEIDRTDQPDQDDPESRFEPTREHDTEEKDDKTDKIKELTDFLEDLKVRDRFSTIALHDGLYGRAHLFIDVGADLDETRGEMATPIGNGRDEITKGKLKKGCLKALRVIEPVWTYPTTYNAQNPLRHDWYNPQVWYVMGKEIHCSRLLTFIGRPVPDLLKPAYSFGGLALSQMAKPYVDIWLKTRSSVAELIRSFSVMVLATDLGAILQPGTGAGIMARVAMFNQLRDNQGTFVINEATEDFKNVSASLGGLHELQAQAQEHMASVSRIPLVKFTGIQPSGLNASSEGEIRTFYDTIEAYQNAFFRSKLNTVIDIAQVSLWGQVDPDITWDFVPLWSMNDEEKSTLRKTEAETGQILVDTGIISQEEERTRIAADPDSPYPGLDPEDVPELAAEEMMGLEIPHAKPGGPGQMPGMPGTQEQEGGAEPAAPGSKRVLPFQEGEGDAADADFRESEHPRVQSGPGGGQFTSGGGGGGKSETRAGAPAKGEKRAFKSKKHHAEYLLKRGVTNKEMLEKLAWPSISMPAMAKSLNMRLEKVKEGGVTKYVGHSLGPWERPEKTHSLLPFLARRGGIRNDDGNISDVRAALGTTNKRIGGYGNLIRQPTQISTAAKMGGQYAPMDLDQAREAAEEAGYLPRGTTLPEFIEFIDRELRGDHVYPEGYLPPERSQDPEEFEHEREGFVQELHNSVSDLSDSERARAIQLWHHEGLNDPADILERIALETDDRETDAGAPPRAEQVPGWDDDRESIPF